MVEKKSSIVERVKQRTQKKLEARELHLSSLSQRRLDVVAELTETVREARFVRMKVTNAGSCPDWHAAAGSESWLFLDEMVVLTPE